MRNLKNRLFSKMLPAGLLFGGLALLPLLQTGCFRPMAALSFVNRESDPSQGEYCGVARVEPSEIDPRTQRSLVKYGSLVQKYSGKYDLDWRLVIALMRHESQFSATARSHRGAFGLMQIMPTTQMELAMKLGVPETESPSNNIKAGIYHLRSLYRAFEAVTNEENRIRLSLAAYNAGLNRILDAQAVAVFLGDDPNDWEAVRSALPLLSKRYYTLHQNIWESGKPRAGYFKDWQQTRTYVETIMDYYDGYQLALR